MTDRICAACSRGNLRDCVASFKRTVRGVEFEMQVPALCCDSCSEQLLSAAAAEAVNTWQRTLLGTEAASTA